MLGTQKHRFLGVREKKPLLHMPDDIERHTEFLTTSLVA